MDRTVIVTGSFHAREQSTLSVKVPGRLEKITVDIGSVVRKGEELARIDRTDYELRVRQAEAVLAQARAVVGLPLEGDDDKVDVEKTGTIRQAQAVLEEATKNRERVKQLRADKIAAQSELDTVEAAYAVALSRYQDALEEIRGRAALVLQRRAELNLSRKQLTDTVTTAPFDAIVHQRLAHPGEYVQTGTPLAVLAAVNPLRLRLEIPERESTQVRPGQSVRVTVGGSTNVHSATIARVSPVLVETSRMLLVEADVPAAPELRPGLFAQAEIVVNENDAALCVPDGAITSFVGIEKVFVVKDGKASEKNVRTGRRRGKSVEVLSGVAAGDVVVLNPGRLRSEQPVIEEANAAAR
ncbi:MAG TPA: efflux RND transporter periplasmic adaptor subunit [Candidatus Limnocylindria bacterium]|nr:efflux RND transporter periplasmic adaptor subunit [Candidatus Limnocylindria bacterium]